MGLKPLDEHSKLKVALDHAAGAGHDRGLLAYTASWGNGRARGRARGRGVEEELWGAPRSSADELRRGAPKKSSEELCGGALQRSFEEL